jgi:hypothetical protein
MKTIIQLALAATAVLLSTAAFAQIDTVRRYPTETSYDSVKFQSNNVILAYRGGKIGVITTDGRLALPFVYDRTDAAFTHGHLKVYKNGLEGVIDGDGHLIVEPIYQSVSMANPDFFVVKIDGKYGTISHAGKPVIPTEYTKELVFYDGLALVELNGKYGYLNPQGDLVIPYQYEKAVPFRNGRALITLAGETYEIDTQNKRVVPETAPKTAKQARMKDEQRRRNRKP